MRSTLCGMLFGFCMLAAATLSAQRPPDAIMLRRIAEALDGNPTGKPVWVVGTLAGDHTIEGVLPDLKSAQALAARLGKGFQVFGSFDTPLPPPWDLISACVHVAHRSIMRRSMCVPPPNGPIVFGDIKGLTLVLERTNGTRDSLNLSPDADAIFLSMVAFDKFAVPYYQRTLGLAGVVDMRREFESAYRRAATKPQD